MMTPTLSRARFLDEPGAETPYATICEGDLGQPALQKETN
jgi:hypothetical protein